MHLEKCNFRLIWIRRRHYVNVGLAVVQQTALLLTGRWVTEQLILADVNSVTFKFA